ncbi:MAG: NUDIX domain-containing protein [Candidatus Dojkabacteria bacterium]|nr:NUDIX domain-containing protein [Candidatus Dojkabacteria bacterium]
MKHRTSGIILKDDKILLMFRRKLDREYYTLPGGKQEPNENISDTLIREIKEETNLKIIKHRLLVEIHDHLFQKYEYFFVCDKFVGYPELGGEEKEKSCESNFYQLEWVPIERLSEINLLPHFIKYWLIENIESIYPS